MTACERFRAIRRRMRVEGVAGGTREAWHIIADVGGFDPSQAWSHPVELRLQRLFADNDRQPDSLASVVLNGFGSLNPWTRYTWSPAARRRADRARRLRDSMVASGRAICDNGGWVREVNR